ncbi:uncharacterized protein LOC144700213 isoform X2 [Wolffia australiana]
MGGCFLGCFRGPKERKRRKAVHRIPSRERTKESFRLPQSQNSGIALPLKAPPPSIAGEAPPPASNFQQRCAADALKPTLNQISDEKSAGLHVDSRCAADVLKPTLKQISDEKSAFPFVDSREESDKSTFSSPKKKVTFDLNVTTYEQIPAAIDSSLVLRKEEDKQTCKDNISEGLPSNHRYKNCAADEDEDEDGYVYDDDSDEEDEDDDDELPVNEEDESYDSYFSLQLEKEKQRECNEVTSAAKPAAAPPIAAAQPGVARDRKDYVLSVLNPVENLSQWKSVAKAGYSDPQKSPRKDNNNNNTIRIDASLSNWLPSRDNQENSPCDNKERPILGALTVEDLKNSPKSSPLPRKSPSRFSPDEISLLGKPDCAIKGIPNTSSKYREDRRVNYHLTPFEVRLERTLNRGDAEAY